MKVIHLLRKPTSEGSVASNVLRWGTGAINVDGCRVGTENTQRPINKIRVHGGQDGAYVGLIGQRPCDGRIGGSEAGRWPANVLLTEGPAVDSFAAFGGRGAFAPVRSGHDGSSRGVYGDYGQKGDDGATFYADRGSASRFFQIVKG